MRLNLDLLAKGSFQTAPDGQRLFFPNGFASKGYVIDSEATYQRLFRQQKRWGLSIMVMISALVAAHVTWQVMLPLFVVLNLLKQAAVRHTTRGMRVSTIPYSVGGFFNGLHLPAMSRTMLYFLAAIGTLVCLGSIAATLYQPELWRKTLGWAVIAALLGYLSMRDLRGGNPRD